VTLLRSQLHGVVSILVSFLRVRDRPPQLGSMIRLQVTTCAYVAAPCDPSLESERTLLPVQGYFLACLTRRFHYGRGRRVWQTAERCS
jgi:hypothetical protein